MARLSRYFVKGQPLHVIQRGNNREPIFAADEDYRFYLQCLEEAAGRHKLSIHAYVLMTNHVHLLASPGKEASLPKTLQSVGRRYVQYFNQAYERTGTLWPLLRILAPAALVHSCTSGVGAIGQP